MELYRLSLLGDIRQDMSFDAGSLMVALEHGNSIPDILPAMSRHQGGESELAPSRDPGGRTAVNPEDRERVRPGGVQ